MNVCETLTAFVTQRTLTPAQHATAEQQQRHNHQHSSKQGAPCPSTRITSLAPASGTLSIDPHVGLPAQQRPAGTAASHAIVASASSSGGGGGKLNHTSGRRAQHLSFKSAVDLNSRRCTAEATWQARAEGQAARLSLKWSDGSGTRVTYNAQVALRPLSNKRLQLTGDPQRIHSASILLNSATGAGPAGSRAGSSTSRAGSAAARGPVATGAAGCNSLCGVHQGQQGPDHRSLSPGQGGRRKQGRPRPGRTNGPAGSAGSTAASTGSDGSGGHAHATAGSGAKEGGTLRQLELGWAFQANTPILAASLRFNDASNASTSSNSSSGSNSSVLSSSHALDDRGSIREVGGGGGGGCSSGLLTQLRAAYDFKSRSINLSAAGSGWNVAVVLPTQGQGLGALVPHVGWPGCRPKVTFMLVPTLASCREEWLW